MLVYILDRRCKDREQIAKWLREDKRINSVSLFDDYYTLFQKITIESPNLCLIRAGDPVIPCFEAAKLIEKNNPNCKTIFLSDSKEYAVEAFEISLYGYLLLPGDKSKLYKIVFGDR
ncbi:response regulator [Anaerovorax odorimutans]|uniref:response regulator n=1 Tax=Anaerovorax odorimutans TaxID=109327 RepID=UPI00041CC8C6|nr:response regulator [Anaerovorax odorimutans]